MLSQFEKREWLSHHHWDSTMIATHIESELMLIVIETKPIERVAFLTKWYQYMCWLIVSNTSKHSSITLQCFFLVTNRLNRYWVHSLHPIEERINEHLHSPLSFFVSIETLCHSWSISLSISFQNYSLWGASNPKTPVRTWNEKPTIKSSLWFHLIVSIP